MKKVHRAFLYTTCFFTGAVILALEILGFRLFAPFFGLSVYVSGSLIGVILTALSLGYYFGGKIADRFPREKIIYNIILLSSLYLILIFIFYKYILEFLQKFGMIVGSISSTIIIFGIPMVLLSMVSPFLIKLLATEGKLGESSGKVFAFSTVGSIAGSFFTTFLFIPFLGSNKTLGLCIVVLLIISTTGLSILNKKYLLLSVLILSLFLPQYQINDPALIHESESAYNLIRIYDRAGIKQMTLNSPMWVQSYKPKEEQFFTYQEYFNLAPHITDVDTVLILGMSAGASIHELRKYFDVSIDAIEIDPEVVRLAEEYFYIVEDNKLNIHITDAKNFLIESPKIYDFVEIDLYQSGPDIPFYVTTQEFFTQVYDHTSREGIVMMNIIGNIEKKEQGVLARTIANTFSTVFPNSYILPLRHNTLLIGTKHPTTLQDIQTSLENTPEELYGLALDMSNYLDDYSYDLNEIIFTDDKAPIEYLTQKVVKTFS